MVVDVDEQRVGGDDGVERFGLRPVSVELRCGTKLSPPNGLPANRKFMFCRWPSKLGAMHTPLSTLKRSRKGASGLMSEVASALPPFLPIQGSGSLPR